MDAVEAANSGHPGMPMGMADIAEVLWNDYLVHNPANPLWCNRDRFVLSNGHGAMLLYSLLHLTGYQLPIDEIKRFRQLASQTPGHPEHGITPGVETTTGPLGQGLANSVGMAIAERVLAARFNSAEHKLIDHYTYVFAGDGCLMEGISHEACSLAGTLRLGKLIVFYDRNGISIDGNIEPWFSDDTPRRFDAYGWQVLSPVDGHSAESVKRAIDRARAETMCPTLICCDTVIGYGAPDKQGQASCHGAALGADEVASARQQLGWPHPPFAIPDEIYDAWDASEKGAALEREWVLMSDKYRAGFGDRWDEFNRCMEGRLPEAWQEGFDNLIAEADKRAQDMATRKASLFALEALTKMMPELIGGSADLAESNCVLRKNSRPLSATNHDADYIYFGVREFAMSAIATGISLHGGLVPYVATFLVFSDYSRNAIRMAALIKQRVVFVFTHDSIGLGEDGATHQPIEHLASLRLIPNLDVWRPCDMVETMTAWRSAVERMDGPSTLALSRQTLAHMERKGQQLEDVKRGGYILRDCPGSPRLVIIATGSEVSLALSAYKKMCAEGYAIRLVSMPCADVFERQQEEYRNAVLPPAVPRLALEAGSSDWWRRYVGVEGEVVGVDCFGASAPAKDLFKHYGFTAEHVCEIIGRMLEK